MKSTLSDNRQLFNIKELAPAGKNPDEILEGQTGIIDTSTGLTVVPTDYNSLPKEFVFITKYNNRVIYSFDNIIKSNITNVTKNEYKAPEINIWEGIIKNCDCTKTVQLDIFFDEDSLMRRDGMTWTHRDSIVEIAPHELECLCDCTGKGVYENNVMTKLFFDKIKAMNSRLFDVEVKVEGGATLDTSEDIQNFIDTNKDVNTDDDDSNDGKYLVLILKGKVQPVNSYNYPDVKHIYPRGVKLNPVITVNGKRVILFKETQEIAYEVGNGVDLREEEWANLNNYSTLNYFTKLSDGVPNPEIADYFQFENGVHYDTVTFEFDTPKVERAGSADMKRYMIIIGTKNGNGLADKLKTMLTK